MSNFRRLILTIALTLMWSPSFLFIKFALESFSPLTVAGFRVTIAAVVLVAILYLRGGKLPKTKRFWLHASVMALFASAAPFYLFSFAEQSIDSALAAILNGTSPMFTALFALFFFPADRLTFQKIIGIFLSSLGLIVLFAPNIFEGVNGTFSGILAATTASISYSISHIYGKKHLGNLQPFVAPSAQLLMSAVYLVPLALWIESPFTDFSPSWISILGVLGLALFGTIFAFSLYYKLLEHSGPTAISTVACFFPVGGMLLGFCFLGESFTWLHMSAATMILAGLLTVNEMLPKRALSFGFKRAD